ncbi:MAG TPA: hypothetical protein DHW82_00410 [Spirochaetia bacterium]|nr:MAG: hypothetical protein A2Y41_07225 [Spirochaetes bacterium GWB1_36_13]HCL55461.1 hypothetical protein [Spirochaetia bacterium]
MKGKVIKLDKAKNLVLFQIYGWVGLKEEQFFEIKKEKKIRSLSQNALYWLFCEFTGNELCMTRDEIHEGFKSLHLKKTEERNGKRFETFQSTADLDSFEFTQYLDKCNLTAIEYGVDTSSFWADYEKNYLPF